MFACSYSLTTPLDGERKREREREREIEIEIEIEICIELCTSADDNTSV